MGGHTGVLSPDVRARSGSARLMTCRRWRLYRVALHDTVGIVIVSFRHRGLERLYRDGSKRGVQAAHVPKLLRILSLLDVAQTPEDLAIPSFRTHPLKGDLAGHWSIWVNGNWRVTFRFIESDVELVDYQDYH